MIKTIWMKNFKSFKSQKIELKPLTMLTGMNGMGKSTVLQALLLLRQSYQEGMLDRDQTAGLVLNGKYVELGTGRDLLFTEAEEDEIEIGLTSDETETNWVFEYDKSADVLIRKSPKNPNSIFSLPLFTTNFHYLQAERVGPRTSFDMADFVVREQKEMGSRGEYAAHFLEIHRDLRVATKMQHPTENAASLIKQVTAWLGDITPRTLLRLESFDDLDKMKLRFGFERGGTFGNARDFRPTNVGFGLTYTLPILVAILSSQPNDLLLLENPEAHLHPRGQSQIGNLIARAASIGVQIILETHSDHILNGIRVATRKGIIAPEQVALHFFQRPDNDSDQKGVELVTPRLDRNGRLDFWPEFFFDEWDRNLDELL